MLCVGMYDRKMPIPDMISQFNPEINPEEYIKALAPKVIIPKKINTCIHAKLRALFLMNEKIPMHWRLK